MRQLRTVVLVSPWGNSASQSQGFRGRCRVRSGFAVDPARRTENSVGPSVVLESYYENYR